VKKVPIYSWKCEKCGFEREEIRKVGDDTAPKCVYCKDIVMERLFTPVTAILKGPGWTRGVYRKVRDRSKEQGNKFFKRHPKLQEMAKRSVDEKPTL
jgi:putative FmdB family regulatory protein